ncbi:MAG: MmgE/PrpD family protein [Alphaproteobacteria bacterium]|jgi:2-methylcitrate dehydratase PrpD|nr:MmgE/PrpD family protein [Alphaproteobacteria bacterium]
MTDVTKQLSEFAANLKHEEIPVEVAERAKLLALDLLGIALRARFDADSTPAMMQAAAKLWPGGGECRVIGDAAGYAPPAAALINGALGHSLDFDDTHAPASLHPSAPVVPAALAAAEMTGASGADTVAGIVAGLEVICRLGQATVPAEHYDRGYHPTATCGAFAAAAAAGRVMGLSAGEIENALGIALSESAGSLQFLENGAWTKRFQVGNAARNGLVAACFAAEGYLGAAEAIEGRYGFLRAYAPNPAPERAVAGLGEKWETLGVAIKPYPGCRFTHAGIDAVIELKRQHGIEADAVEAIEVGLSRKGVDLTGEPQDQKRTPESVVDGQFSMHFLAGVALVEGGVGWDDYKTHLGHKPTLELLQKVAIVQDERIEAVYPENLGGSVRITTLDGETHESVVEVPKGEPANFVSAEELRAKFSGLVTPYIGQAGETALYTAVMELEAGSVADIFRHATPPGDLAAAGE